VLLHSNLGYEAEKTLSVKIIGEGAVR